MPKIDPVAPVKPTMMRANDLSVLSLALGKADGPPSVDSVCGGPIRLVYSTPPLEGASAIRQADDRWGACASLVAIIVQGEYPRASLRSNG